ncbi:hypothetical protein SND23_00585, partial [Escherichia coli]|nr:hypothetical protein [Escherichia coli]MDZ9205030.1 hypothetical protein [Escherichia coli]MDZ9838566.1 hypothetical protein [Escherichia coli]
GGTADRNRSHWSTSKTPSYTKSVSWQHHLFIAAIISIFILGVGIKKGIGVIPACPPRWRWYWQVQA